MEIYAISHKELTPYDRLLDMLAIALESGVSIFQFRDKDSTDDEIFDLCVKLSILCAKYNALFVINDRVELALRLQKRHFACGLHLGKEDLIYPFSKIREYFFGKIGVSCYGDINRAIKYQNLGADYVAFGSIFQSKTKKESQVIGHKILSEAKKELKIKICAIGGINASNVGLLESDMVAMINAIWVGDIKENIYNIKKSFR